MFCSDISKIHHCYVTCSPCITCVKMLLNTGCKEIHFSESYPGDAWKIWCAEGNTDRHWCHHGS